MSAATQVQESGQNAALEQKLEELKIEESANGTSETPSVAASLRELAPGILKTPIVDPLPTSTPEPAAELTPEQQTKYESLLETVKAWTKIPSTTGKEGPISDDERFWLTRECLLRYLRATKWNTADGSKRLLSTLTWRREYGVNELTGDHISPENETGKQIILGFDIAARPCLYLNPGRQNTSASPRQVQHLVFMLERVIEMSGAGQETLALLINFKTSKSRSNTAPGIGQGREVLNILQTHYPERLGRALIINVPWVVSGFFKLITPFIDPLTRQKLKFNDDMRQHVPPSQLWNEFHGDLEFEYDHEVYWPAMLKLCEEKSREQRERWEKAGKHIGESESYIKGGNVPSLFVGTNVPQQEVKEEVVKAEEEEKPSVPVQTNGTQANGNMDIAAVTEDPVISTEGDRS